MDNFKLNKLTKELNPGFNDYKLVDTFRPIQLVMDNLQLVYKESTERVDSGNQKMTMIK